MLQNFDLSLYQYPNETDDEAVKYEIFQFKPKLNVLVRILTQLVIDIFGIYQSKILRQNSDEFK
jgi:hypothetical protein